MIDQKGPSFKGDLTLKKQKYIATKRAKEYKREKTSPDHYESRIPAQREEEKLDKDLRGRRLQTRINIQRNKRKIKTERNSVFG